MQEELVSFETAKLAKEKRFGLEENDYCQLPYYYNLEGELNDIKNNLFKRDISTTHLGALTLDNVEIGISFMDNSLDEYTLAPTQSLLQKWLREIHNIHITIDYNQSGKFSCRLCDEVENNLSIELFGEYFNSYEEALGAGLQEALNLIPTILFQDEIKCIS